MKQSDFTPFLGRYMASAIVSIAVITQIGFLWALARFILFNYYSLNFFMANLTPGIDFLTGIPLIIIIMFAVFNYFSYKKISIIMEKYSKRKIYSFINVTKFFCIIFIPLIIAIILVNHSIVN